MIYTFGLAGLFKVLLFFALIFNSLNFANAKEALRLQSSIYISSMLPTLKLIFSETETENLQRHLMVLKADESSEFEEEKTLGRLTQLELFRFFSTPEGMKLMSDVFDCDLTLANTHLGINLSRDRELLQSCRRNVSDQKLLINSRRNKPREYYFVFLDRTIPPEIESWTDQNNNTLFILPGRHTQPIDPDKLLNHLVHEISITYDSDEKNRTDEINSEANGICFVKTALAEPFMALVLKTLRALNYEKIVASSARINYQRVFDNVPCLTKLKIVGETLRKYSEQIGSSMIRVDSCKIENGFELGLFSETNYADSFAQSLADWQDHWSHQEIENYCNKWTQSPSLKGQSIYFNFGPKPRLGGGGW